MTNDIVVRVTEPHEYLAALNAKGAALLQAPFTETDLERAVPSWTADHSSFSAWDGELCVGHAGGYHSTLTVPGGTRVPNSGVTRVGVLPTHRRRGIAKRLIHRVVADADDRGFVTTSLRASEATIYGRFGYAVSSRSATIEFDPRQLGGLRGATSSGGFRFLRNDQVVEVIADLADRVGLRRPGAFGRSATLFERDYADTVGGNPTRFVVVHVGDDGVTDGFVRYRVGWTNGFEPDSTGFGAVDELFGADDGVELALWEYVRNLDVVTRWTAAERPVDELVPLAAVDPRAWRTTGVNDEQWLRIVDVDQALAARAYARSDGSVTIAVTDPLIERNNGTWRVSSDGAEPVDEPAELTAAIATLSAAYLGGTAWRDLVAVGDATATAADAAVRADRLFAVDKAPFAGTHY